MDIKNIKEEIDNLKWDRINLRKGSYIIIKGFRIVYEPKQIIPNGALCVEDEILVNDSFLEQSKQDQKNLILREVCFGIAESMIKVYGEKAFIGSGLFGVMHKFKPGSMMHSLKKEYWEGLFGDLGQSALLFSIVKVLMLYINDSETLRIEYNTLYMFIEEKIKGTNWGINAIE